MTPHAQSPVRNTISQKTLPEKKTDPSPRKQHEPDITIAFGLPFHRVNQEAALVECERILDQSEPKHIVTANADFIAKASKSPDLQRIIVNAHRILCDGQPIVWMSKILKRSLPGRVTGSDLTPKLLALAEKRGDGIFILGTDEETLATLDITLRDQYPGINLAGAIAPPYGPIESWDNESYVEKIRESGAKLLLVCLGFPKQDVWIDRYLKQIETVPLAIGIGASLDFIAKKQIRAPRIFQAIGMEWFWRMASDPKRMVGRYTDDFLALANLGSLQLLGFWGAKSEHRNSRLMNGIELEDSLVIEPSMVRSLPFFCDHFSPDSVVMDCRNENLLNHDLVRDVVMMLRFCEGNGIKGCLFNAPQSLVKHLAKMHYSRWLPSLHHPAAVQAWANAAAKGSYCSVISLRVPNRLDHEEVSREFTEDVFNLIRHAPSGVKHLTLNLEAISNLSICSVLRLVRLKRRMLEGETETEHTLKSVDLVKVCPEVVDLFEMLGLSRELNSTSHEEETTRIHRNSVPEGGHRGNLLSPNVGSRALDSSEVALPS